jgi:hypothetical protein
MRNGKRTALLTALCFSLALPWTAGRPAAAQEIGDVIGEVLTTDIQAYVNGHPIPSMNVFGYTAVIAEDLRKYGFDVAWIPQQRRLVIHPRSGKRLEPIPVPQSNEEPGIRIADVLYTDIETFYGDTQIPSYNIDGKTVVLLNDLAPFGQLVWSEQERKLSFTPAPAEDPERPVESPLVLRQTGIIALDGIAFGDEEITHKGAAVGKIVDGWPMMSVKWMAEQFGYSVEKTNDGFYVQSDTYSFLLHPGNNSYERFWFGYPVGEDNNVYIAPVLDSDGELLAYETDLKRLFGYYSVWDPETRKLNVEYRAYLAEDYGLPESLNNYFYSVRVDSHISGIDAEPTIFVTNRVNGKDPVHGGSSGGSVPNAEGNGPNFRMVSSVPVDFGRNEIDVMIAKEGRILFHQTISAELSMEQVEARIDYDALPYSSGEHTKLESVTPEQAYIRTAANSFEASGKVIAKHGDGLTFTIEVREGEQYRKISEHHVPFDQDAFVAKLALPDEPGLYRITAVSLLTNPRFTSTIPVAIWYVDKTSPDA